MNIDVFLSRKSADRDLSKKLYRYFISQGLTVFESDESLPQTGNSDFRKAIDLALDTCNHLLVIGSSVENITSSWVEAEWGFYIGEKRAGRKKGNILTLVTNNIEIKDLPPSLRNYEVINFSEENFEKILAYVSKKSVANNEVIIDQERWYQDGLLEFNTNKNFEEAAFLFEKAAKNGHPKAEFNLGYMNENGLGMTKNYEAAFKWYMSSAEKGYEVAQGKLGVVYYLGNLGIEKNNFIAYRWLYKASQKGDKDSLYNLGVLYDKGAGVVQNYQQAFSCYKMAAVKGHISAQFNLGLMYQQGLGIEQDYKQAFSCFKIAAENGHIEAQFNLALMYQQGGGVKQNNLEAFVWYSKAAVKEHVSAQLNLAVIFMGGLGVQQEYSKALFWCQKALENGSKDAHELIRKIEFLMKRQ